MAAQPRTVARFRGAPVMVSSSVWLTALIFGAVLVTRWTQVWRISEQQALLLSAVQLAGYGFSVLVHELAHAETAHRSGQRVLAVVLTFWGGVTSSVPRQFRPPSWYQQVWVSASGPLANVGLAVVLWSVVRWQEPAETFHGALALTVVGSIAWFNLALGAFNLLPGAPLDGGAVLAQVVGRATGSLQRGRVVAAWAGRVIAVGVVAVVVLPPLLRGDRLDLVTVVWSTMLGAFLWSGASQSLRSAQAGGRAPMP